MVMDTQLLWAKGRRVAVTSTTSRPTLTFYSILTAVLSDETAALYMITATLADMNSDALKDVVAWREDERKMRVLLQRRATSTTTVSTFTPVLMTSVNVLFANSTVLTLQSCDMNADGKNDVVVLRTTNTLPNLYALSILRQINATLGTFEHVPVMQVADSDGLLTHVVCGDVDGDGDTDLVVAGSTLTWLERSGAAFVQRDLFTDDQPTTSVRLGDVNADGMVDILATQTSLEGDADAVYVFLNAVANRFATPQILERGVPTNPMAPQLWDMDRDGDQDVLVSTSYDTAVRWYANVGASTCEQPLPSSDPEPSPSPASLSRSASRSTSSSASASKGTRSRTPSVSLSTSRSASASRSSSRFVGSRSSSSSVSPSKIGVSSRSSSSSVSPSKIGVGSRSSSSSASPSKIGVGSRSSSSSASPSRISSSRSRSSSASPSRIVGTRSRTPSPSLSASRTNSRVVGSRSSSASPSRSRAVVSASSSRTPSPSASKTRRVNA